MKGIMPLFFPLMLLLDQMAAQQSRPAYCSQYKTCQECLYGPQPAELQSGQSCRFKSAGWRVISDPSKSVDEGVVSTCESSTWVNKNRLDLDREFCIKDDDEGKMKMPIIASQLVTIREGGHFLIDEKVLRQVASSAPQELKDATVYSITSLPREGDLYIVENAEHTCLPRSNNPNRLFSAGHWSSGLTSGCLQKLNDIKIAYDDGIVEYTLVIEIELSQQLSLMPEIDSIPHSHPESVHFVDDEAPTLVFNTRVTVEENKSVPLTLNQIRATDIDTPDSFIIYRLVRFPYWGEILLDNVPLNGNITIAQAQYDISLNEMYSLKDRQTASMDSVAEFSKIEFTHQDLRDGRVSYRATDNEIGQEVKTDSFEIILADGPCVSVGMDGRVKEDVLHSYGTLYSDEDVYETYPYCHCYCVFNKGCPARPLTEQASDRAGNNNVASMNLEWNAINMALLTERESTMSDSLDPSQKSVDECHKACENYLETGSELDDRGNPLRNVRDYSGTFKVHLVPCVVGPTVKYESPSIVDAQCQPRAMPITFDLPIEFQQTNEPTKAVYTLDTDFMLLQTLPSFLSDPKTWNQLDPWPGQGAQTNGFDAGETIYARITVNTAQPLAESFQLKIQQVYLCTGSRGYVPQYNPQNREFGCIQDSPNLARRFKLYDALDGSDVDTSINNLPFDFKLADLYEDYGALSRQNDDDGFSLGTDTLFQSDSGFQWYLQAVYIIEENQLRRRRSSDSISHLKNISRRTNNEGMSSTEGTYINSFRLGKVKNEYMPPSSLEPSLREATDVSLDLDTKFISSDFEDENYKEEFEKAFQDDLAIELGVDASRISKVSVVPKGGADLTGLLVTYILDGVSLSNFDEEAQMIFLNTLSNQLKVKSRLLDIVNIAENADIKNRRSKRRSGIDVEIRVKGAEDINLTALKNKVTNIVTEGNLMDALSYAAPKIFSAVQVSVASPPLIKYADSRTKTQVNFQLAEAPAGSVAVSLEDSILYLQDKIESGDPFLVGEQVFQPVINSMIARPKTTYIPPPSNVDSTSTERLSGGDLSGSGGATDEKGSHTSSPSSSAAESENSIVVIVAIMSVVIILLGVTIAFYLRAQGSTGKISTAVNNHKEPKEFSNHMHSDDHSNGNFALHGRPAVYNVLSSTFNRGKPLTYHTAPPQVSIEKETTINVEDLQRQLQDWTAAFTDKWGQPPTKQDIEANPTV
eukprot:UC4_evm1s893